MKDELGNHKSVQRYIKHVSFPYCFRVPCIFNEAFSRPDILEDGVSLRVPQRVQMVLHLHTNPVHHLQNRNQQFKAQISNSAWKDEYIVAAE